MKKDSNEQAFLGLIQSFKAEWQSRPESALKFSEKSKRSLLLKIREIEKENNSVFPWELSLGYLPKFSLASTFSALLCFVTFQFSQGDMSGISMNEQVESDYSELIASNEQNVEVDSNELLVDEQQEEEL